MSAIEKLLHFFSRRDKVVASALLLMMLVGAGFEALSIALVFPFIAIINNPEVVQNYRLLHWAYEALGLSSTRSFLVWCGVGLMLVYLLKTVYLSLLYYAQYRFIFNRQVALAHRLLSAYLRSPYAFHLQRNSANLLRNINDEVPWIFSGVLVPVSSILVESLVIAVIVGVLLYVDPVLAIGAIGVLGGASAAFYRLIRKKIKELGEAQQHHNTEMIKWINQGLGGVKEIKVLGREAFFVNAYLRSNVEYTRATHFLRTVNEMPRLALEGFTLSGLLLIVLLMLVRDQDMQRILPLLGVFAMAAIRLMPSLNRIVSGLTMLRYYSPAIHAVHQDLKDLEGDKFAFGVPATDMSSRPSATQDLPFIRAVELKRIWYHYPGTQRPALADLSLTIRKGQTVAFVGPSGAGKTTVVDIILGLLKPTSGQVLVDGVDIQHRLAAWHQKIGYIPQRIYLCDNAVRRNVAFGVPDDQISEQQVWQALRAAQLESFVRTLPRGLDTVVGEHGVRMSAGQRQRIGIARALYHDPPVLVLDEATSALDNETESGVAKAIFRLSREKTVLIIAHRLSTVRDCDCLFFMQNGQLVAAGSYAALIETNCDFRRMVHASSVTV